MTGYLGLVPLGNTLHAGVLAVNPSTGVPAEPDAAPNYSVYGPDGLAVGEQGSLSPLHTGDVTGASNASPIEITSAGHGLQTGMQVTLSGVLGNTAANGTFTVTKTGTDTFTLDGSSGNGAYTSGGSWTVSGLYSLALDVTSGNGYAAGEQYTVLVEYAISSTTYGQVFTFDVG